MFTSKGLFSSIPCPYDESCMLPKCLFLHSKFSGLKSNDDLQQATQRVRKHDSRIHDNAWRNDISEEVSEHPKSKVSNSPGVKPALRTVHGDVSPPRLRRTSESTFKSDTKTQKPMPNETQSEISKVNAAKKQRVETLNPRMIKSSPASHDLRYRLLKALHDQIKRLNNELKQDATELEEELVLTDQAVITMALDIEEEAAIEKPSIYSNVVKNSILAYKRMTVKDWKDERAVEIARKLALQTLKASNPVPLRPIKPIATGLSPEEELSFLPRLFTPISGLVKHGYVPTVPTEDEIEQARKGLEAAKGWEVCDRCKSRFQVFPGRREEDGALTSGGPCVYHWGKAFFQDRLVADPKTKRERKYTCCGESIGDSRGCTRTESHVFKVSETKRLAALLNFQETPKNLAGSERPVCIDGEMGYTVHGLELIRLTATLWPDGKELLDVLVRPFGEILDLNSRFSGVWPQQMADAKPWGPGNGDTSPNALNKDSTAHKELCIVSSPAEARSLLFRHLTPHTPLIGHGLENDLNAVRIVHPTIIDTALLYPHTAGLPYRNGLKALMLKHLGVHIQVVSDDKVRGHDSKEDANAAGDLVRHMIETEWAKMKKNGWILENHQFIPPEAPNSFQGTPSRPSSMLTVHYLEMESQSPDEKDSGKTAGSTEAAKCRNKRPLAEISRDELEDGEVE